MHHGLPKSELERHEYNRAKHCRQHGALEQVKCEAATRKHSPTGWREEALQQRGACQPGRSGTAAPGTLVASVSLLYAPSVPRNTGDWSTAFIRNMALGR